MSCQLFYCDMLRYILKFLKLTAELVKTTWAAVAIHIETQQERRYSRSQPVLEIEIAI